MKHTAGKRKIVEIYFVLHLAALIFLLPDFKPDDASGNGNNPSQVMSHNFSLYPDKTSLACIIGRDTTGIRIIELDTSNQIFYTGDVEDVSFEFSVENRVLKQTVTLNSENPGESKFFSFHEDESQKAVIFSWDPPLDEMNFRDLVVTVTANAYISETGEHGEIIKHPVMDRTRFGLNIYLENMKEELLASDNTIDNIDTSFTPESEVLRFTSYIPGGVNLDPWYPRMEQIALNTWKNKIFVSGMDLTRDLKKKPEIKTFSKPNKNGGTARIDTIQESYIFLSGITPYTGSMKVEMVLKTVHDDRDYTAEFHVVPVSLRKPGIPEKFYPGVEYSIRPNLPRISLGKARAVLTDNDRINYFRSDNSIINLKLNQSDTNKIFHFIRYFDTDTIDIASIRVESYLQPEIIRLYKENNNKVKVVTRSQGFVRDLKNYVDLNLIEGNAVINEIFPPNENSDNYIIEQKFNVLRADNSRPFTFKLQAVDKMGKKSKERDFKG